MSETETIEVRSRTQKIIVNSDRTVDVQTKAQSIKVTGAGATGPPGADGADGQDGEPGPPGADGGDGGGGSSDYTFDAPSYTWTLTHNLGLYPVVTVIDNGGNVVISDVVYVSNNEIIISFEFLMTGKVFLAY